MPTESIPDFPTAIQRFREFLACNEQPTHVMWVRRQDVRVWRGRFCLRWPLPESNAAFAEQQYNRGRTGGIGVCFEMLCLADGRPCCFVWFPQDQAESARRLCRGLKLSIPKAPKEAYTIRSGLRWRIIGWLGRDIDLDMLPIGEESR